MGQETSALKLRKGLLAFGQSGEFSEDDFVALRALLGSAMRRTPESDAVLDGLIGVFFERHVLDDTRRAELIAMDDEALGRAVRHRFRQLLADEKDDRPAWHALSAHVRDALASFGVRPTSAVFPASIRAQDKFSPVLVEQAVAALWLERGSKPTTAEATGELLARYVTAVAEREVVTGSREFPEVVRARLDAQRLARAVLEILNADEKDLFRHVLEGVGTIDAWSQTRGVSRATAYRMLARLKSLCRLEWIERSPGTRLEILEALRVNLQRD